MNKENIINNKLKFFFYLLFMAVWIIGIYYKGYYTTEAIYTNNIDFIFLYEKKLALFYMTIVFFSFLALISFRGFKSVLIVSNILISIILLGDIAYGRYYDIPLSLAILDQIVLIGSLGNSTKSLLTNQDLMILVDIPILLLLSIYLRKFSLNINYKYRMIISFIFMFIYLNYVSRLYNTTYTEKYVYDRRLVGQNLGVYYYHYDDAKSYINGNFRKLRNPNNEEILIIENANQATNKTDNEYTGLLEGKNVIVIQLEAFQNFVINREFNGIEITPNLNRLIEENSIYASNFYYETAGGNTVDAELLANTSMIPTYSGSPNYLYPYNAYISMPQIFKDQGYTSNSFHAYDSSFWNREIMHKTLGYDKFYSVKDYDFEPEDMVGWSIADENFLKDSLDKTIEASNGENFYSYMITLSSHYPYEAFYNGNYTWSLGREEQEVPIFERYLNATQYVDYAIGEFIEYLKSTGQYEDTVIVIFGDHGGLFFTERLDIANMLLEEPSEELYAKYETVPLIIHNPDIKESIITDKVSGQKDIMPTLLNLMNIELKYTLGNDILSDEYEGIAIKRYGNIYTNDFIYLEDNRTFYDFTTLEEIKNEKLTDEYMKKILEKRKLVLASEYIYTYDYLRTYRED